MFLKKINKKNKGSDKVYTYYRLVNSYKIGNKIRHRTVMSLGSLDGLPKHKHKALADRIEELITGSVNSLFSDSLHDKDIEKLAQEYADKIIKDKLFNTDDKKSKIEKEIKSNFQEVDLESIEQIESKQIGGEWLVKQAFKTLGLDKIFSESGLSENQIDMAQMLLSAKMLHPSSELETQRWLCENSAAPELYQYDENISRYKLYKAAELMFSNKDFIDNSLYTNIINLFSGQDKIVVFDLSNMYFDGSMQGSSKAQFGRSKQKQSGSKLIGLALSIDSMGFVRYSKFYKGNISEPTTFDAMLKDVSSQLCDNEKKPIVVMDAGIATEDNLDLLRSDKYGYDYVCVSRVIPKEFETLTQEPYIVSDNRGHKIELTKIDAKDKPDMFLHVKSEQKLKKEDSIDEKLTKRLEAELQQIKEKLSNPRTLKKAEKVHEKVGKIKAKLSRVGWLYDIKYIEDKKKEIVTDIVWKRVRERERPKGEYFIRYTSTQHSENNIWQIYNLTREDEAVFRTLKTDLDIRPIYHQKDNFIEPHIWLGILSYQVVNYIRTILKEHNINYSWQTIVEKMQTMQTSIVSAKNKQDEKIYIKLCTRPTKDQKDIFNSLSFKNRPFVRKTKLVPQM